MNEQSADVHQNPEELQEKIQEDLAHFYNYPSIGKLFAEPSSNDLQNIRQQLNSTRERLDVIIRKGSNEEAAKAAKALEAIRLTLDFLQNMEDEQQGKVEE